MKLKVLLTLSCVGFVTAVGLFAWYWIRTQPIRVEHQKIDRVVFTRLPPRNRQLLDFIETTGKSLAPRYDEAVCTEFVIKVIDPFKPLSATDKRAIRIITGDNLPALVHDDAPIIRGVQEALVNSGKGVAIDSAAHVLPGDFVQFWNVYNGKAYGHCGVVMEIEPEKSLTLYSSHPMTDGYGKQKFLWPGKTYFVRLK
ncbi:hypothetical protein [Chryseolinea lacunae]|uniref:CHAP domain-containing protein n=1 Tax=Chryseolinea lacunae TaxID=2801331 RepID=A0ABS1KPF1_9BACT|nr:hypothetical protein [Chryseolinea lacunae]MBL0740166.1 hypothetical protein [Chryseolinea lacunae]